MLPDGQSQIERGFNINNDIMVENMKQESLEAHRLIYNTMSANQVKPDTFIINNAMKHNAALKSIRVGKEKTETEEKCEK